MTTVKIIICKDIQQRSITYCIYKELACCFSPILNAAFSGGFIEGQPQTTTINDFLFPEVFGIVQGSLYKQTLTRATGEKPHTDELYQLWILADQLLMPRLQDQAMAELVRNHEKRCTPLDGVTWIYKNTAQDSPLRRFLSDQCARDVDETAWIKKSSSRLISFLMLLWRTSE